MNVNRFWFLFTGGLPFATESPSPSSGLLSFLSSLPLIFTHRPHIALSILLRLVDLDSDLSSLPPPDHGGHSNPLFQEDPLNNYMEEVEVLAVACQAVQLLLSTHTAYLQTQLDTLVGKLVATATHFLGSQSGENVQGLLFSPWERPGHYLGLCRLTLLSEAILVGSGECGIHGNKDQPPWSKLGKYVALKNRFLV